MNHTEELIQKVWEKGKAVEGYNPDVLRKDEFGAWIIRSHYGSRCSEYSWEIDSLDMEIEISEDNLHSLRPLQWENKSFRQGATLIGQVTAFAASNLRVK